jgi:hypothetical protein
MRINIRIALLLVVIAVLGCPIPEGGPRAETAYKLLNLGKVCERMSGQELERLKSFDDFLNDPTTRASLLDPEGYRQDAWGNAYVWEVSSDDVKVKIRIGSSGADGRWQHGTGDDLYVDLEATKPGKAIISFRNN